MWGYRRLVLQLQTPLKYSGASGEVFLTIMGRSEQWREQERSGTILSIFPQVKYWLPPSLSPSHFEDEAEGTKLQDNRETDTLLISLNETELGLERW